MIQKVPITFMRQDSYHIVWKWSISPNNLLYLRTTP